MNRSLALAIALGLPALPIGAMATPVSGLQQKGTPDATAGALSTYGIEVPARTALKSLIPTGWRLFVHRSAVLPSALSWKPGDVWTDVLTQAALTSELAVLVDWEAKTVLVRTLEVAAQESSVRAEIAQAASTPLPRFEVPVADPAPLSEKVADASSTQAEHVRTTTGAPGKVEVTAGESGSAPTDASGDTSRDASPLYAINTAPTSLATTHVVPVEVVANPQEAQGGTLVTADLGRAAQAPSMDSSVTRVEPKHENQEPLATSNDTPGPHPGAVASAHTLDTALAQEEKSAEGSIADSAFSASTSTVTAPSTAAAPAAVPAGLDIQASTAPLVAHLPSTVTAEVSTTEPEPEVSPREPSALEIAVAKAIADEQTQGTARPANPVAFHVDAAGNVTARDALTALAVSTTIATQPNTKPAEPDDVGPAGRAALLAMANSPVESPEPKSAATHPVRVEHSTGTQKTSVKAMTSTPFTTPASMSSVDKESMKVAAVVAPQSSSRMATEKLEVAEALAVQMPTAKPVTVEVPVVPVFPVNPTAQAVQERAAVAVAPALKSTNDFTYTEPVALNRPPARMVAQAIANKFGLRLVWVAPEIQMQGPVTLLAQSAGQDVDLLRKALGIYTPVTLELGSAGELRVISKDAAFVKAHQEAARKAEEALAVRQALENAQSASQYREEDLRNGGIAKSGKNSASAFEAPALEFTLAAGEPLELALKRLLQSQGFTHEWKVAGGFEANKSLTYSGKNLVEVLSKVLPPLGISADIYTIDKHIVIRPGDYRE